MLATIDVNKALVIETHLLCLLLLVEGEVAHETRHVSRDELQLLILALVVVLRLDHRWD